MDGISADITSRTTVALFTKVLEQHTAPAARSFDVAAHRGGNVSPPEVLRAPKDATFGRFAVSAAPARLLIVGLERTWRAPVQHLPDIGFVDAHPERTRRDDDPHVSREE